MYSETYPNLKAKYDVDNFETIAEAIDTYYSELIKLDVLNSEASKQLPMGSYANLFDACMLVLKGLYTVDEVVKKLYQLIHEAGPINTQLIEAYVLVPPVAGKPSAQLGFLEKIATDSFKMAEPVSSLDMMRLLRGIETLKSKRLNSPPNPAISVANLSGLHALDIEQLKRSNQALIVNFNRDLKRTPKWGVVDMRSAGNPTVFCETPLTQQEKGAFERLFSYTNVRYEGETANSLESTGYTALAWLETKITKAWPFDVNANFAAGLKDYVLVYYGGDNPGIEFRIPDDANEFCTPAFQRIKRQWETQLLGASKILTRIAELSGSGSLQGVSFRPGDIGAFIRVIENEKWDVNEFVTFSDNAKKGLLLNPPGLAATMSVFMPGEMLVEDKQSITLKIPSSIDRYDLTDVHARSCVKTSTNSYCLTNDSVQARMLCNVNSIENYYAVVMLRALVSQKAKKRIISIDLPKKYNLPTEQAEFIIATLSDNAYVTELNVNDHAELKKIQDQLKPILARNRWLEKNGYRPPLIDDYWKQVAKYWLQDLREHADLLTPSKEHDLFKRCVLEMGIMGMQAVLTFLNDEEGQELLGRIYNDDKPAFYAACQPDELPTYLGMLLNHLRQGLYFPYSQLGLSYQPGNDRLYIDVLEEINHLGCFEKTILTDFLKADKRYCRAFLAALTDRALRSKWVSLVVIPELAEKDSASDSLCELRSMYALLNDVILRNLREAAASLPLRRIEEISNFRDNLQPGDAAPAAGPVVTDDEDEVEPLEIAIQSALARVDDDDSWPFKKGGVVQLQLQQQQQQIQQNRQIQQEQQHIHLHAVEEALAGELVTYANIDTLLRGFYTAFSTENRVREESAVLRTATETILQGFFHTWVSANPNVEAHQTIHQMTQEAARALLRKHRMLVSGLNPDNLPKGFYTQRSKDGQLILCYNPELAYVTPPNALTLNLDVNIPQANAWDGDFRQFDVQKYLRVVLPLDSTAWNEVILFAQLQPEKNYSDEFDEFCKVNSRAASLLKKHRQKCLNFWPMVIQLWQYKGQDGLNEFLRKDEQALMLPLSQAFTLLIQRLSRDLQKWCTTTIGIDQDYLCALGQIYHRWGDKGLGMFLTKLRQIHNALGDEFFATFDRVIRISPNFNCFMSEKFFTMMDAMIEKLKPLEAQGNLRVWQNLLRKHMDAVEWDNVDTLWKAFDYFLNELDQMGLALDGDEFDDIAPENMVVCLDRILLSLKNIPDQPLQQVFLSSLSRIDRTHGGVPYALQYEGFKEFNPDLQLTNFVNGSPTYSPDLLKLYSWAGHDAMLKIQRTIASQRQFSHEAYPALSRKLVNGDERSKDLLMWLLHTQYPAADMIDVMDKIESISLSFQSAVAKHLHQAVYQQANQQIMVNLSAMVEFDKFMHIHPEINLVRALEKHGYGTLLEAVSILHQTGRWSDDSVKKLLLMLQAAPNTTKHLEREGYKLATLFGIEEIAKIHDFLTVTADALPVVHTELRLLMSQLLSLDFSTSNLGALASGENWQDFMQSIQAMKADPAHTALHRIALIEKLNARGLNFKYSKSGDFRALTTKDQDGPAGLSFFVDHEDRIWKFMQQHIAVPNRGNAQEALEPIIRFLKRLQLNRTYLNEIEPLLASLEKTEMGNYWSANYFYQLLRALQPEDEQSSFPISLLNVMLQEESITAKPIDSLEKEFPPLLKTPLQIILKSKEFNRTQQALLCQIALREYHWQGSVALLPQIIETLSLEAYAMSRGYALEILTKCNTQPELESRFDNCRWLMQCLSAHDTVQRQWPETSALWLKAISTPKTEALFTTIKTKYTAFAEKQILILHIVGWSTLHHGLKDSQSHLDELDRKAEKLVLQHLEAMTEEDLALLAKCYPYQPSPSADDIIRLHKRCVKESIRWPDVLEEFKHTPFSEPRADYRKISGSRESDLRRMQKETQVSRGEQREGISAKHTAQLTLIFAFIKRLETGESKVDEQDKSIADMNQAELAEAFIQLSRASTLKPKDDLLKAQIWAILFEVLGRTTRKYPHLAQQYALIANDICIDTDSRVLQLATGEGKSHFVAMRAVRHAGCGKTVDICTAKRTLSARDLKDYDSFFTYLGFKTAHIHPKSSHDTYIDSQIHYSTLGDLSLFLDEQSFSGQPITIPQENRIALFDEFDYIVFEEGRKTEYNYARPTGRTPKQMTWFYQCVNRFYLTYQIIAEGGQDIDKRILNEFILALRAAARENEERQGFIKQLLRDPLQLVQWLQSAYEAHALKDKEGFTSRIENIELGDESYPMREIIPLSGDNQLMIGSTFSAGVHQLLAVRMNTLAKEEGGKPQNYHIHPESNIISSQVAEQRIKELYTHWEGFSGTISAAQATTLFLKQGTSVLHVPTNQRDTRVWHKPGFYANTDEQMDVLVRQIRSSLKQQKSILFSCKNDLQVVAVQEKLKALLTPGELANFVFFTNDEHRTAEDVLNEKREMEDWRGGKKQQGVCLVASGFGRGDNVNVEAVFLLNVNDTNDLLQKGGRTARNGEDGEVFQFYLQEEVVAEEQNYLRALHQMGVDIQTVNTMLNSVKGDSPVEKCFEKVMLLREYLFSIQNEANQAYHNGIAQLSTWGMNQLGRIEDPAQRVELTSLFSRHHKSLEKRWIAISSRKDQDTADKIEAIAATINDSATEFARFYDEKVAQPADRFMLKDIATAESKIVVARPTPMSATEQAVSVVCNVMSRLPDLASIADRANLIPEFIDLLSSDAHRIQRFARQVEMYDSADKFVNALYIAHEQVRVPSENWAQIRQDTLANKQYPPDVFLGVSDETRARFDYVLDTLLPHLQTKIIDYLVSPTLLSSEHRMQSVLPCLTYLGQFDPQKQKQWGSEYIEEIDRLINGRLSAAVTICFQQFKPLRLSHLDGICRIADQLKLNDEQRLSLILCLYHAIQAAPEHRMRMLTRWESWLNLLDLGESESTDLPLQFLQDFSNVMSRFSEGTDWDTFVSLVNKTNAWWKKGDTSKYQNDLLRLWERLNAFGDDLQGMNDFIKWGLSTSGKSWFRVLNSTLSLKPEHLQHHEEQLKALWNHIENAPDIKKSEIHEAVEQCTQGLICFYEIIMEEQAHLIDALSQLEPIKFRYVLRLVKDNINVLTTYGCLLPSILGMLNDAIAVLPFYHVALVHEVFLLTAAHPQTDEDKLFRLIELFGNVKEALFAQSMEKFHLIIELTKRNIAQWIHHIDVLRVLMGYLCDERLSLEHAVLLNQLLLSVATHQEANQTNVFAFIALLNQVRAKLFVLPLARFGKMIELAEANIAIWFKYPEGLMVLMECICDARIELTHMALLNQLLISAMTRPEASKVNILTFIDSINLLKENLYLLPINRFRKMVELIELHLAVWLTYPLALRMLMSYMCDLDIATENIELLNELLLKVIRYHETFPTIDMEQLLRRVTDRFSHVDIEELRVLNELLDHDPTHLIEPLFDGAVAYLAQTREDSRETIRTVIQEFYVTSKQSSGDPVGLMQSAAIRERFASENVPMAYRKKRTVLMHLLHHGVLVTEPLDVIEHDHHDYQWSHDKNDQLSTLGYEHYIRFTKNILEEDMPAKASLYKHHDLSTTQQFALLKITDELAAIGRLDVEEDVLDSTNKLAELSKGLGSLINNYQGSWFKSIERKTQLVALRDMVNRCLNEPNETSRYEVVMGAISRAKYAAIDNDRVKDRDRKWFKLNRSGHSRYLNTLNQMQDLVIRHWVQDSPALLAFQNYQQFSRNDFKELTQRFCERVTDYSEETYLEANDPRNRQLDQRVFNFFINEDVKVRLQALKVGFEAFIQADGPLEDADNIEQLINDLRKTMPKLSGHLITLGNELLSRGDALLMHLREQEQMNAAGRDNSLAC